MAMQAGVGLSRIFLLAGAGYTGTIMMKNGKLSDLLGELQSLVKGMEKSGEGSEGDSDVSDAIAAQVRRLAMEIRQLASQQHITVMNGVSGDSLVFSANLQALAVPAAALGALGYGYMWWKGLSFTDLMYVTKANMAAAVANLTKNLEQVSETLAAAKRHLTQRIQNLDDKVEKQIDLSKEINSQVISARENISSLEMDLESLHNLITGLDGKLDTLEYKQDVTNVFMLNLYNYFGGKSTKLPEMEQLQLPVNQRARNLLADVETKGLKNLAEELFKSNGTQVTTTVKQISLSKVNVKSRPLLSRCDKGNVNAGLLQLSVDMEVFLMAVWLAGCI
ncbi:T7N9.6 [Arabidopsis thaliana]|uniref:T7N9.6 n=1 Tax=Arabidopsis thaliana TaxID=3702 RepID=Q9LFY5_ARATH|nr:T7N9.6 [Arabidopsis thaliana]